MSEIPPATLIKPILIMVIGTFIGSVAIWVGDSEDGPGAILLGAIVVVASWVLSIRTFRKNFQ